MNVFMLELLKTNRFLGDKLMGCCVLTDLALATFIPIIVVFLKASELKYIWPQFSRDKNLCMNIDSENKMFLLLEFKCSGCFL